MNANMPLTRNYLPWPTLNFMAQINFIAVSHLRKVTLLAIAFVYLGPVIGSVEAEVGRAFSVKAISQRGFSVVYETLGDPSR
jgi:hypothetical protein